MFGISLILIIATFVSHVQCEYGSVCRTPDNVQGICVPVKSCRPAYEFFQQVSQRGGSITQSEREEIQELHCGTFNKVPHVCCAQTNLQLNPDGIKALEIQECGIYTVNKVTNGFVAKLSGYPWMALLIYDDERDPYKCAGSLITELYVLTAAHCIRGKESILKSVRLGEHRKSTTIDCVTLGGHEVCAPPAEDIGIAELILHPMYRAVYNDIALIRLERKVQPKRHISTICLPINNDLRARIHDRYVISGWGRTEDGNSSDVLLVAAVPRVETATCEAQLKPYHFLYHLDESHLCAGGIDLVDTCGGDSGGPVGFSDMYNGRPRFIQYGIVAAGLKRCGEDNVPGIYTNVSHHIQWITDHIKLQ